MFYCDPPKARPELPPALTAKDALQDLPSITLHPEGKLKRGARRFNEKVAYAPNVKPSAYATKMRSWPNFESHEFLMDHVIRYLPRDYKIFRRMNSGDQYPEAHKLASQMLSERLHQLAKKGTIVKNDTADFKKLEKEFVPPYDPDKFPNKWRKMEGDRPARTLMAHLGKDGYSHIHYDSAQARTISVREAARLQSFPDGFFFSGTMNPAFRKIGNAVPPLLAKAIGQAMIEKMVGK